MQSIRRNLLKWQIGSLLFIGAVTTIITSFVAWNTFSGLRDDNLAQIAYSILRHGTITDDESNDDGTDRGQFLSQVWDDKGQLVFSSTENDGPPRQKAGYHTYWWNGEKWHTFTFEDSGLAIQVGNPVSYRYQLFFKIAMTLLLPLVLMISILGILIWYASKRILSPLQEIRSEVLQQHVSNLTDINLNDLPEEIMPLGKAVNDLFGRISRLVNKQSEFISNAAHELKTPLTAVRLQTQLVMKAEQPAERARVLQQLLETVDRSSHLVEQLLQMARLEEIETHRLFAPVRFDLLAENMVAELIPLAEGKNIDCGITQVAPVTVTGNEESLRILISNLVENALRYTPDGGRVDIGLRQSDEQLEFTVSDTGPGIPEECIDRVFERFFRVQANSATGSGLGLAIVKLIAESHGGRILIRNKASGGLEATFNMPAPPPTAIDA